jgi:hypothetical protein
MPMSVTVNRPAPVGRCVLPPAGAAFSTAPGDRARPSRGTALGLGDDSAHSSLQAFLSAPPQHACMPFSAEPPRLLRGVAAQQVRPDDLLLGLKWGTRAIISCSVLVLDTHTRG